LDTALAFVIGQVEQEATRSGVLLDQDEQYLLTHLPTTSIVPTWADGESPTIIPRDLPYEKLCNLTKVARVHDLQTRPDAAREWEFAASVFKLHRHPMSWLLKWAGVRERRPWWDGWVLFGAALALIICLMAVMLFAETRSASWTWIEWAAFSCGSLVAVVGLYFASRRFEGWQAKQAVERCRRGVS
jgi:hypothetical protein